MARILKKNLNRSVGGNIVLLLFLLLVGLFMALPLIYSLSNALKPLDEIMIFPPRLYAKKPTPQNFLKLFQLADDFYVPFSRYVFNSVVYSVVATVGHILMASMAAFAIAKHDFVGKKVLTKLVTVSLLFTTAVLFTPKYLIESKLHIINTPWTIIFEVFFYPIGLYLMMNFMGQLDDALIEAAKIDGASEYRIYWSIVMPNVKPAWITACIFAFGLIWNNSGYMYIYREDYKTIPAIVSQIAAGGSSIARMGANYAAFVILLIPPILLFIFSQNRILETMTTSGMK